MMITEALKTAQHEHIVYFLLTAYVETLGYADAYGIPEKVKRLPIVGEKDVRERSRLIQETLSARVGREISSMPVIKEARDVFNTAGERLETI